MEEEFVNLGFLNDSEIEEMFKDAQDQEDTVDEETNDTESENQDKDSDEEKTTDNEKDNEELHETKNTETVETESPNSNSSIALALMDVGVLQTHDEERLKSIQSAEELADIFEEEIQNRLDEHTRRIDEALKYKMEIPDIQRFENTIKVLDSISEDKLEEESDEAENVRRNLIYQNYINRNFSEEEAQEMVERSFSEGNDVKDAKKALESCKRFYNKAYNDEIADAKAEYAKHQKEVEAQAAKLKDSILNDKGMFEQLDINKTVRQKIYDTVSKPSERDENGNTMTKLQKYIKENPTDFYKTVGMFYVLTDGFKKIDNLIKGPVKKEVKKGIDRLSRVIDNTSRDSDGSFRLRNSVTADKEPIDIYSWNLG